MLAAPPLDAPPTTETALDFAFLSLDLNETSGEAEMAPDFYPKSMVSFKHECCNAEELKRCDDKYTKSILLVSGTGCCDTADALGSLQQSHKHWLKDDEEPTKPQQLLLRPLGPVCDLFRVTIMFVWHLGDNSCQVDLSGMSQLVQGEDNSTLGCCVLH